MHGVKNPVTPRYMTDPVWAIEDDVASEALPKTAARAESAWHRVLGETLRASTTDRVSLAAAGCAFYATLALFPAISMLISIGGLVLDPVKTEQQLSSLSSLLPPPAFGLIEDRVHQLVSQSGGSLSVSLAVSFLLTFWSSATGSKSILSAVNVAYDTAEQRPFLQFQIIGLSMTLIAALCAIMAIGVLLLLPPAINFLGLSQHGGGLIHAAGRAMLIGFFFVAISLLYRFGPSRPTPQRPRIKPGAALATVLWLIASELLSLYVSRISTFGATYGSLGAAVGVMLWFYVSAYAVLLGAELNARLEDLEAAPAGSVRE
ncbi:MAG: YihY/virulence factor BrkB family protein [Rhodopila sp.]|nr:YihY/virulence factor BrkB family protein [Rhodopila sp.]